MGLRGWFASCFGGDTRVRPQSVAVYYGSESGGTKALALRLGRLGAARAISITVHGLETFDARQLVGGRRYIFMTASYGTGGPTTNANSFFQWLKTSSAPITIEFCVFGVGSSIYADSYNGMGKAVDAQLAARGGHRFYALGLGDSFNDLERDFLTWEGGLWAALATTPVASTAPTLKSPFQLHRTKPDTAPLAPSATPPCVPLHWTSLTYHPNAGVVVATVALGDTTARARGTDHLVVYPCNPDGVVESLARRCNASLDHYVTYTGDDAPFRTPATVRSVLTHEVDCQSISRSLLSGLAPWATDDGERSQLAHLGSLDGATAYADLPHYTVMGVLTQFASTQLSLVDLLPLLSPMAPRSYTIASHTLEAPTLDLVIAVPPPSSDATLHFGVMATYLHALGSLGPDAVVPLRGYTKPSTYSFPTDVSRPLLMIAAGSGIAPMRALWQQRPATCGPMHLFFGCRTSSARLFEDELLQRGVQTHYAYSRDASAGPTMYVQDMVASQMAWVQVAILEEDASVFVCGRQRMVSQVRDVLQRHLSAEQWTSFAHSPRYQEEVFG
ncbi:hypothetical protein SPRG_20631 [Saprolegnia parasitica CBS 223.65]|uniref:NADPH--hemoprotein reductase n=1 Tax=Saprolegnia parasitica (strain CBS 223.65) TaxID=695850 RepID=A0A067CG16_SAPPC|nr:hypothetical protein SPRG_20631 [Saprolegnia parasitica CBS 223.65]KDO25506.1 hypothetical protein SPRG_20631 [Saprolegnia parasitica CBS 223.65]|eukprot:XP_012203741.1 hypothetical protein SPRG_20631 [Saprolegnia parasitica CBS 223.65]